MKKQAILPTVLFAVLGCKSSDQPTPATVAAGPASAPSSRPADGGGDWSSGLHRGAPFGDAQEVALAEVLVAPEKFAGRTVKTRGLVARACVKKGCWMELQSEGAEKGVRVTFKDYGFFVPRDSAGSKALVEGSIALNKLSPEDAKHLEEEGARIMRNEAGEAIEIALVASAVELEREN